MTSSHIVDVDKALVANLPKALKTDLGDTVTVTGWYDEAEDTGDHALPFGTFLLVGSPPMERIDASHKRADTYTQVVDTITYTAGIDVYQVAQRDIHDVVSLTGTRSGSPHTFVEDTDFELHVTSAYSTVDAIMWLPGGDTPDDGTAFTLTYRHTLSRLDQAQRSSRIYRLALHVKETTIGLNFYPKFRLGSMLQESLLSELGLKRGQDFAPGLRLHEAMALPPPFIADSEGVVRSAIDIRLSRYQVYPRQTVEFVGKLDVGTTLEP